VPQLCGVERGAIACDAGQNRGTLWCDDGLSRALGRIARPSIGAETTSSDPSSNRIVPWDDAETAWPAMTGKTVFTR
jgi:hypothetical protein